MSQPLCLFPDNQQTKKKKPNNSGLTWSKSIAWITWSGTSKDQAEMAER